MLLSHNPLFVGRELALRQLADALRVGCEAVGRLEIAAVTGLGGIGKTQLACEFVHRYGQFFTGGVLWLSFADPAAIPAEVAACGGVDTMHLSPEFGMLSLDEQVRRVSRAWEAPVARLLVFDNCEDVALLDRWRPKHGGCRVLITSRRHYWDPALGVRQLPLDVLPRHESQALLRTFRPELPPDNPELEAIAATLGDLPLALHLAGSFLAKYRHAITPLQYLQRLHTPTILDDRSLRSAGLSPTRHVQHVARTFEQSYERLDQADPTDVMARKLLAYAAHLAPGVPIPRWLLQTMTLADGPDAVLLAEDALLRLIDLGLLEPDDEDTLRLHQLLVAFVLAVAPDADARESVDATMRWVVDDINMRGDLGPSLALQPHLRFVIERAKFHEDARLAGLYTALGDNVWLFGLYPEAQRYFECALAIQERVLGCEHPDTALSLHNMGVVLRAQGQYARARIYHEQALAIRERLTGKVHPDTAWSLYCLGKVLREQGDFTGALRYYERALAIREQVFGREHRDTAWILHNLGAVWRILGEYARACAYHEQALAIRERVFGREHPDIAWSLNGLGVVWRMQGDYDRAQDYHEQALAIQERALGREHPDIVWSLNGLGVILRLQGQHDQAREYHEQALAIREQALGREHPETAWCLHHLGMVWRAQGEYERARECHEQALSIRERTLGREHLDTAWSLHTMGVLYRLQGDYTRARSYHEQALAIRDRAFGLEHRDTARSLYQLGLVLYAQGASVESLDRLRRALAIFELRLGPDHSETRATQKKLLALDKSFGHH
ncbi:MAG TPA: FxSxx-COOH system tetratricopeptide repeat protein [Herpetosiphonaceae bacterium]